ncbi:hypothetical protein MTR67_003944, partial [Solanum verrucosum]
GPPRTGKTQTIVGILSAILHATPARVHSNRIISKFCWDTTWLCFRISQNINIHFDGASLFGKNDISKTLKKGGRLGGRKALNDIPNSAKPSSLQSSKKNSTSVISIGKDLNATKNKFSAGTKDNFAEVPDRVAGKLSLILQTQASHQQSRGKGLDRKLSAAAAANIPTSIAEEQFLHDHKKCIKAQRKVINMGFFLKEVGLDNDDKKVTIEQSISFLLFYEAVDNLIFI